MRTAEYPYFRPAFPEFNVAQEAAIPFLDKDLNLVISFATAAGKTVLAECCFGYHLGAVEQGRVAYVCPFRSLAAEKFDAWKKEPQFVRYGIMLNTGDSRSDMQGFESARMAILTSESFDSKTRSGQYRKWIQELVCVVFDEAHLIGTKHRGCSVEASLMRLTWQNPSARIVLLSATMGNAMELAKWLKSLNGKATKCVTSSWRPVKVETEYHAVANDHKVEKAVELVGRDTGFKTIVFTHSKLTGALLVKSFRAKGIRSLFHNASLTVSKRRAIEERFNDRMSGMNVLVSTSTLGAGVNLAV